MQPQKDPLLVQSAYKPTIEPPTASKKLFDMLQNQPLQIKSEKMKLPKLKIQKKMYTFEIKDTKDSKWHNYIDFLNKINLSNNQIV